MGAIFEQGRQGVSTVAPAAAAKTDNRLVVRDPGLPLAQGLYNPANEKDACGVGFIADMKNRKSHAIISQALQILHNLDHRGAVGADPKAGDGCGMLVQIPHAFFAEECARLGFTLPAPGHYAVGFFFLPRSEEGRTYAMRVVEKIVADEGQTFLGWRAVPVDNAGLGESVLPTEPVHMQAFIGRSTATPSQDEFERRLFIIRKSISNTIYNDAAMRPLTAGFYPTSVSSRTVTY